MKSNAPLAVTAPPAIETDVVMGEWPPLSWSEICGIRVQKFRLHIGADLTLKFGHPHDSLVDPDMRMHSREERGYVGFDPEPRGLA